LSKEVRGFPCRRASGVVIALVLLALQPACSVFVHVPLPRPFPVAETAPAPLTKGELLRFAFSNLGEIAPGFAYRSRQPSPGLIRFLKERVRLGHIVTLRGKAQPDERAVADELGIKIHVLRMSAARTPTPEQVLRLIRITEEAKSDGTTLLLHCMAGADRASMMTGVWRMLYQGVDDRDALKREAFLHYHQTLVYPNVYRMLETFRAELFQPFVENPALLDDPVRVADVKSRYFGNYPLTSGSTRVTSGPLRAGVAKADLLAGWSAPIPMATYGPLPGVAGGITEPVFARALVLDNGATRLAIVSCDLLIIDPELRTRVLDQLLLAGVEIDDFALTATHTHTSVGGFVDNPFGEFYILNEFQPAIQEQLAARITAAVSEAASALRPAKLGVGRSFVEGISFNRRLGSTVDSELGLIRLTDTDGAPLAVVVNYTGHPILEPDNSISPDYPGRLCRQLDEKFGFGLFLQGALGDVNIQVPGKREMWRTSGAAQQVADILDAAVTEALPGIAVEETTALGSMTFGVKLPPVHAGPIPDFLYPFDQLLVSLLDWPEETPVQTVRIGAASIVACGTEAGVRLGLRIKRRSPSAFPFVVSHAGGYAGYAVTQTAHARCKLDPTSVILNSSRHGRVVVDTACAMVETLWDTKVDPAGPLLSPAVRDRIERQHPHLSQSERTSLYAEARAREERELLLDEDPTQPQSRRLGAGVSDSLGDRFRVELASGYLARVRGGNDAVGRRRDTEARLRVRAPADLRFDLAFGYRRSDWRVGGTRGRDEGATDLSLGVERPFLLASNDAHGNALRLLPRLTMSAPTGDADRAVPFAFAVGSGVWRPGFGGALEFNWETYRTLALETLYTSALDRREGRRPGDRLESALRYRERHGAASVHLDLVAAVQLKDQRRGGRAAVDILHTSFALGLRPALSWHFGEPVEAFVQGFVPLGRSGGGADDGRGVRAGLVIGF
jgi:neutral ceramidase